MANLNPPSLFEDGNLQSIFGILDPSGKGSITFKQYNEGQTLQLHFEKLFNFLFNIYIEN